MRKLKAVYIERAIRAGRTKKDCMETKELVIRPGGGGGDNLPEGLRSGGETATVGPGV